MFRERSTRGILIQNRQKQILMEVRELFRGRSRAGIIYAMDIRYTFGYSMKVRGMSQDMP